MVLLGTVLNVAGILAGAIAGLLRPRALTADLQSRLRTFLGGMLVLAGLHLMWAHLSGGFLACVRQVFIVLLSMSLGRLAGRLSGLQAASNRLGQFAAARIAAASRPGATVGFSDGFLACTTLYCVAPLALLGSVQAGLGMDVRALVLKGFVDGLAAMAFVGLFRGAAVLAALPMAAWQGTLTLLVALAAPWLQQNGLISSIQATGGLLLCSVALLVLELRKVPVADYLPSLLIAPLITWFWHG